MRHLGTGRAVVVALAVAAALGASGCGGAGTGGISKGGDTARGETLFKEKCAGCHGLDAAGAIGGIGPDLDDAFASVRAQGFEESSIQQVVAGQIRDPLQGRTTEDGYVTSTGTPAMPADLVTGDDVDAVAAYVAANAGKPSEQPGSATDGKTIFTQACGSCHTLADAGTSGTVGPSLDASKPDKALVVDRVTNGKGGMPSFKGQLTAAQIQAVADYVSGAAGR